MYQQNLKYKLFVLLTFNIFVFTNSNTSFVGLMFDLFRLKFLKLITFMSNIYKY